MNNNRGSMHRKLANGVSKNDKTLKKHEPEEMTALKWKRGKSNLNHFMHFSRKDSAGALND